MATCGCGRRSCHGRGVGCARQGRHRDHRARSADGDARGALPRPDRVARGGRMTAVTRVYKWEVFKLLAQKRTYLGMGAAVAIPLLFVAVLLLKSGGPNDEIGRAS